MKHLKTVLVSLVIFVGCGDGGDGAPSSDVPAVPVSTDLQSDLWHGHRHVHDEIQLHDHEHDSGFVGGHDHPHGHTHRHAETSLSGTVVSLYRVATAGQVQGDTLKIPPRLHLEVLSGLPDTLTVCLLTETAESGWSYWGNDVPEITIVIQAAENRSSLRCLNQQVRAGEGAGVAIHGFKQQIPLSLRHVLTTGNSRLRISEFSINIGNSRFLPRERLYFQNKELSLSLQ
jgi:hypothetical protein